MNLKTFQGVDTVIFARKLKDAATKEAQLVPWQTSLGFDPSRDSDSTATKDGAVNTTSAVETDLEVEFINNNAPIADAFYDSLFDGDMLEVWIVYKKRLNENSEHFAWYAQGTVSEDSNDNDADDNSTRDVTFAVNGTPKRGWLKLSAQQQSDVDYVFRGLTKTVDDANGGGTAWKESDAGVAADDKPADPVPAPAPAEDSGVTE